MTDVDFYYCPNCAYVWQNYNRPPPYAWCPECDEAPFMRQATHDPTDNERVLFDAGFIPATVQGVGV